MIVSNKYRKPIELKFKFTYSLSIVTYLISKYENCSNIKELHCVLIINFCMIGSFNGRDFIEITHIFLINSEKSVMYKIGSSQLRHPIHQ